MTEQPLDPTTSAIEAQSAERDRARAECVRLRALVEQACGELDDTGGEFAMRRAAEIRALATIGDHAEEMSS